jgi:hypothetical protein
VQVADGLRTAESPVAHEVLAARGAWPQLADGLPRVLPPSLRASVTHAAASAHTLHEPAFLTNAGKLTGPAAGAAGLYESYERLTTRGWRLLAAAIGAIVSAPPTAARFARANSDLYVDAVYDAHFDLSLLGKSIASAYAKLGGPHAFGAALTQGEVDALASAYSIPRARLEPHPARTVGEA